MKTYMPVQQWPAESALKTARYFYALLEPDTSTLRVKRLRAIHLRWQDKAYTAQCWLSGR